MDFIQSLDPTKLVSIAAGVSFFTAAFASSPTYNLPLLLFGAYVQENSEAIHSIKLFTALLGSSVLVDIFWLFYHEQHWLAKLSLVSLILLKAPTFLAFATSMRQRGAHFSGIGLGGGETVWSMPGGFTSGGNEGYESVTERRSTPTPTPAPAPAPSVRPPPSSEVLPTPGAYQSV